MFSLSIDITSRTIFERAITSHAYYGHEKSTQMRFTVKWYYFDRTEFLTCPHVVCTGIVSRGRCEFNWRFEYAPRTRKMFYYNHLPPPRHAEIYVDRFIFFTNRRTMSRLSCSLYTRFIFIYLSVRSHVESCVVWDSQKVSFPWPSGDNYRFRVNQRKYWFYSKVYLFIFRDISINSGWFRKKVIFINQKFGLVGNLKTSYFSIIKFFLRA